MTTGDRIVVSPRSIRAAHDRCPRSDDSDPVIMRSCRQRRIGISSCRDDLPVRLRARAFAHAGQLQVAVGVEPARVAPPPEAVGFAQRMSPQLRRASSDPFARLIWPLRLRSVYESDLQDLAEIGWDRFITEVWESIFVGCRTAGIRTICRRWSDLIQAGLGCSEELADELVRVEVMIRQDRDLMAIRDPEELLAAMHDVLADMRADLADPDPDAGLLPIPPGQREGLLAAHARLCRLLCDGVDS